jgi:hypothetical protein
MNYPETFQIMDRREAAHELGVDPEGVDNLRHELHTFVTADQRRLIVGHYVSALALSVEWRNRHDDGLEAAGQFAGSVVAQETVVATEAGHEREAQTLLWPTDQEQEGVLGYLTTSGLAHLLRVSGYQISVLRRQKRLPAPIQQGSYSLTPEWQFRNMYGWQRPASMPPLPDMGRQIFPAEPRQPNQVPRVELYPPPTRSLRGIAQELHVSRNTADRLTDHLHYLITPGNIGRFSAQYANALTRSRYWNNPKFIKAEAAIVYGDSAAAAEMIAATEAAYEATVESAFRFHRGRIPTEAIGQLLYAGERTVSRWRRIGLIPPRRHIDEKTFRDLFEWHRPESTEDA